MCFNQILDLIRMTLNSKQYLWTVLLSTPFNYLPYLDEGIINFWSFAFLSCIYILWFTEIASCFDNAIPPFLILFLIEAGLMSKVRNIWVFSSPLVPSKWEKKCSVSFAQLVYFLREVCLLFNFWMIKLKSTKHTSLKKYKNWYTFLSFWGNKRRKNQIFRT